MTTEREHLDRGSWAEGDPTDSSSTWLFDGADGLRRLSGFATFSALDPSRFHARLTRVQVDHIAVQGFAATPYRTVRTPAHIASDGALMLTFVFLKTGRMRVDLASATFDVGPGEFAVIDSRDTVTVTAEAGVRSLASTIGLQHIPAHLISRGTTIPAALSRTPLVDSFVAFQATVLSSSSNGRTVQGDLLIKAIAELHSSVLAEAQHLAGDPIGLEALRLRIEEHIDAHLPDPGLNPESIAAAIGISVRHAHKVFNTDERTIGKYIRDRRTEAVADALHSATGRLPMNELAERFGFASSEALSRAFRGRYGMSTSQYRAEPQGAF